MPHIVVRVLSAAAGATELSLDPKLVQTAALRQPLGDAPEAWTAQLLKAVA